MSVELRNIAIIAHVDHGKTTLVDAMFRHSGVFRANQKVTERAMDREDIERERGITILSKCTSVSWGSARINIVDTPGHADFGAEVERILDMVDGVLLLVDAAEGPMPQTKFVTGKALKLGLKPIVVINKVDRPDARIDEVHEQIFDLFAALDANEEQLDFPVIYTSGRDGWATLTPSSDPEQTLAPLFELIMSHVPPPAMNQETTTDSFKMLVTILEYDPFLGRILTGRIHAGMIQPNAEVIALDSDGNVIDRGKVTKLLGFRGVERVVLSEAGAGDIVAIAGLGNATVAQTICAPQNREPLHALPIDPPTLAMHFSINDSPLAGQDGTRLTSRMIRERLMREMEGNVALRITDTEDQGVFEVAGRGELQLGVFVETLRREGFELSVSRPRVVLKEDPESGQWLEPIEEVHVDVDDEFTGVVIEKLNALKAELQDMRPSGGGKTRLLFLAPSRGLIGYHGLFLTDTRGTGVMHRLFSGYAPFKGEIVGRRNGVLVANSAGRAVGFALWNLEDRGVLFITPGTAVYEGMIIGEHNRGNDLDVNALKSKQLTNIRASGTDENIRLTTPRTMSLEEALTYINDDELVEITPHHIRLRKRYLDFHTRRRHARQSAARS